MNLLISALFTIVTFVVLVYIQLLIKKFLAAASLLVSGSIRLSQLLYNFFFFPGVVIHELAHFFSAAALGVRTGDIEIFPKKSSEGIRLGSVKVEKTDAVRTAIIGTAPLIVGASAIFTLLKIQFPFVFFKPETMIAQQFISTLNNSLTYIYLYLIFVVSNTMILSKSDRKGLMPAAIILSVLFLVIYLVIRLNFVTQIIEEIIIRAINSLTIIFSMSAIINILFLIPEILLVKILEKIRKKKVILKGSF